jgi:hypothetical protein
MAFPAGILFRDLSVMTMPARCAENAGNTVLRRLSGMGRKKYSLITTNVYAAIAVLRYALMVL